MEKGFYNSKIGYWQTIGGDPKVEDYMAGTIEVSLKPSADHVWQNGEWVYVAPTEPTPEELRELMPPISKRQLRLTLARNGISLADLDAAIETMGDEAIIEWQDASEYRRLHPLLNQVAAHLCLSQDQVDGMWQQALSA